MQIHGTAAVVTGGGTGMGGATADLLAAGGAKVALLGRRQAVVDARAAKIGGLGVACDVSDPASIDRALAKARDAHGPARIVVNSAADGRLTPAFLPDGSPLPVADFLAQLRTNLVGPFYLAQQAVAQMRTLEPLRDGARGIILNVSSIASSDGAHGGIAYTASKGGLDAMTLGLAREFSQWGIRVVTLVPGPVDTEMARNELPEQVREAIRNFTVFPRRQGRPEEFAKLAMHVIDNDFINGCLIRFDGGMRVPYVNTPAGGASP
jgi:NAD(P)-dependent dehydrogenase (short-subunit alcohol dehydrogenase family)